jgi:hypothetical protein
MQPRYEFTASLKIRHPNIDPTVLTRELGLVPQYSWRAGDVRSSGVEGDAHGKYRESCWVASVDPPYLRWFEWPGAPSFDAFKLPLEGALMLGTLVLKRRHDFWRQLQKEGATAEFLIVLASRERFSLDLPSDLLLMMATVGLSVSVDIQPWMQAAA